MAAFYINNTINTLVLQSFVHFAENEKKQNNFNIDIYIDETEGVLSEAFALHKLITGFINDDKFEINVLVKHATTAGIIVMLAVPLKNRFVSKYVSLTYSLLMNTEHDSFHEETAINLVAHDHELYSDIRFREVIEIIARNTKLSYLDIEKYTDTVLDMKKAIKFGFANKSFQPFTSTYEIYVFTRDLGETKKLRYLFPSKVQSKIFQFLENCRVGMITKNELVNLALDTLITMYNSDTK